MKGNSFDQNRMKDLKGFCFENSSYNHLAVVTTLPLVSCSCPPWVFLCKFQVPTSCFNAWYHCRYVRLSSFPPAIT